jgi:hypothetical protein
MTSSKYSAHQRRAALASVDAALNPPAASSEDEVEEQKSPLYISQLGSVLLQGAFTMDACSYENIPKENGVGELLHMKFVMKLDYHGQYSCLGPYFNLFDSGVHRRIFAQTLLIVLPLGLQIDISNLKKTRVQFELHFLAPEDEDSANYPPKALEMSCRVLETMSTLTTAVKDRCNAG